MYSVGSDCEENVHNLQVCDANEAESECKNPA